MKSIMIQVNGLMCGHCESRVTNALMNVEGIVSVKASAKDNQVLCEFDETKITVKQIKDAIEDVGYEVVSE